MAGMALADEYQAWKAQRGAGVPTSAPPAGDLHAEYQAFKASRGGTSGSAVQPSGSEPGLVEDVARSAATGLRQGVEGIAAIPGNLDAFEAKAIDWVTQNFGESGKAAAEAYKQVMRLAGAGQFPTTEDVQAATTPVLGPHYQPKTVAGEYARTVGEFAPGAALVPGGIAAKAVQTVVPALASETAGQLTEGTDLEGPARFLAAVGTGVMGTALSRSGAPRQMLAKAMEGLPPETLRKARGLMRDAEGAGIALTWPEAIQQATGGATALSDVQRVVEGSGAMRGFYAARPQQVEAAGRSEMSRLSPAPMTPEALGPRVQQGAEAAIDTVRQGINRTTRPLYQAAEPVEIPAITNETYSNAVKAIRNNPDLPENLRKAPVNSVQMADAVQKVLRDRAEQLANPSSAAGLDRLAATNIEQTRKGIVQTARQASPEYGRALDEQSRLRRIYLEPLENGPLGQLRDTNQVKSQASRLLPANPTSGSEIGVKRTVQMLVEQDPDMAANLVRQHAEGLFNETTQKLASGPNQFGGAKFAAAIAGNAQQRKNLEAAVKALPDGETRWRGFNRFLQILEATGQRQRPGSMTAFNAQAMKDLEQGGLAGEAAAAALSPQKALSFVSDAYKRFRLGRGVNELARLFVDPDALPELKAILSAPPASQRAIDSAVRLLTRSYIGTQPPPPLELTLTTPRGKAPQPMEAIGQ